jgi:hypothetical protein
MIWDVHPDPDFFFIPDTDPGPRVKKAPDSGSATLTTTPPPNTQVPVGRGENPMARKYAIFNWNRRYLPYSACGGT